MRFGDRKVSVFGANRYVYSLRQFCFSEQFLFLTYLAYFLRRLKFVSKGEAHCLKVRPAKALQKVCPHPKQSNAHRTGAAQPDSELYKDGEGAPQLGWGAVSVRRLTFVSEALHVISMAPSAPDGDPHGLGPHGLSVVPCAIRILMCLGRVTAEQTFVQPERRHTSSDDSFSSSGGTASPS